MANVKNFGLVGVADNVQYGKAGPRLKHTAGAFEFRNAADGANAALTAAGITSSAGNVTLTTGNLVASAGDLNATLGNLNLAATGATVVIGTDTTLSRHAAGIFKFNGTAATVVPTGTTLERPAFGTTTGGMRYNTTTTSMEYSDGTAWQTLAAAGVSVASITGTANQITASSPTGAVTLSTPSTFIAPGSIASTSTITAATGLTVSAGGALVTLGGVTISTLTANSFLYSGTAGLLTTTAAPTNGQLLIGSTGVAPVAAALTAGTGISITNGAGSITVGNTGVTSVDVSGGTTGLSTSGGPITTTGTITLSGTLVLANGGTSASLTASNGSIVYSTASAMAMSTVGTLGQVLTSSGAGAPTWTGTATGNTASTLVLRDASGDFSAGIGTFTGSGSSSGVTLSGTVTNPTDATTKAYVDAVAEGLHVHAPTIYVEASALTATYSNGAAGVGATLTNAGTQVAYTPDGTVTTTTQRILVKSFGTGVFGFGTLVGGSGYLTPGLYSGVALTGGTGTGATADITVTGTAVTLVTLVSAGTGYTIGDSLSATDASLGGRTGGSAFSIPVASLQNAKNGIYTVTTVGSGATNWVLTRATDFDTPAEVGGGDFVFNQSGATYTATGWVEIETTTAIGTSTITFQQFSGAGSYTAGAGLTLTGTVFSANVGSTTMFITGGNQLAVDSSATANQVLLSSGTVGNEATYGAVPLGNSNAVTGTLLAVNGGTGFAVYAVGDLLYADTTTTLAKLADVAAGSYLRSGGVSTAPVWSTTTLPNSATTGDLLYASASNTYSNLADVATGNVLRAGGVGVAPSYGQVVLTTDVTGTLPVANGGTGQSTLLDTAILIGNGTGAIETSSLFTHNTTSGEFLLIPADNTAPADITINAAGSTMTGVAGAAATLAAGNGTVGTGNGGSVTVLGGSTSFTGNGGAVFLRGGASNGTAGTGGDASLEGGASSSASTAGSVFIDAGQNYSTGNGGNVRIRGGQSTVAGGYVRFDTATTGAQTERFRILANGAWSVGPTGTETGTAGQVLTSAGASAVPTWATPATNGTVTSIDVSGGTTGLTTSGGPVTTSGTITLAGTLVVANGGTGQATLLDTGIMIGNGTAAVETSTELTFDSATGLLTVGGANGMTITANGGAVSVTSLDTNANINLIPNGTGSVVVGSASAGVIKSNTALGLTVNGVAGLTLTSGTSGNTLVSSAAGTVNVTSFTGDITMTLGTGGNVTVAGVTAAAYSGTLADADLANKYYVDSVIATVAGDVKAVRATVSLASTGSFNIGSVLPAGVTILSVKVNVTVADTATGTLQVGKTGGSQYMTTTENDTQTVGLYLAEDYVNEATAITVQATVGGTPGGAGSADVIVTYQIN
jgi:hypothetical protein